MVAFAYLSKLGRLRRQAAPFSSAGLSCRLGAFGGSFGNTQLKLSQFCMRDLFIYIFSYIIIVF